MKRIGIFLSLIATLMLVSFAFASWKGTGLRLGITKSGSTTTVQGVQMNSSSVTALDGTFTGRVAQATKTVTNGTYNSTSNPINVGGANVVKANTSGSNVDISGFANGTDGQVLQVVVVDNSNSLVMQHTNSSGTQQIYLQNESDQTLSTYGGFTLVCNGTAWFEAGD